MLFFAFCVKVSNGNGRRTLRVANGVSNGNGRQTLRVCLALRIDYAVCCIINSQRYADMAQSVAHLIGSEEVTSSIIVVSIKKALVLRLF